MKHRIVMLLVFLLLGTIVNVAVAWGTALRLPAPLEDGTTHQVPLSDGMLIMQHRQGDVRVTAHRRGSSIAADHLHVIDRQAFDQMLPHGSAFHDAQWIDDQLASAMRLGGKAALFEHSHGWPMLAMSGSMTVALVNNTPTITAVSGLHEIGPISIGPISTAPSYRRVLPLVPLWSGFAINTLFYATILWLLIAALFALRRSRRIKRGLCPACAYPVGASDLDLPPKN